MTALNVAGAARVSLAPAHQTSADPVPNGCAALLLAPTRDGTGFVTPPWTRLAAVLGAIPLVITRSDPLWPHLDLAENVALPLRARGVNRRDRRLRAAELLGLCGLETTASGITRLDPLARRLVLLARALAVAPAALALDRLTAELTEPDRALFGAAIRRTCRRADRRMVVVTTERAEALALADLLAVATDAEEPALAFAPPAALLASPPSAAIARALTEANLLTARVADDADADPDDALVDLSSGDTVPARLAPGVRPGSLCQLAIAPERIAFAPVVADRVGGHALRATLTEHRHCGSHLRLRVRLLDGTVLLVHRPPGSLGEREARAAAESGGASVAWRSVDAVAFPHPEG